jgi:hypothetical protein
MRRLLRLPSPAMTVAVIAVVLALTGTATALVGTNRVFKDDIAANAVGRSETRTGAVKKAELGSDSVGKSEAREDGDPGGGFTGAQINEGALGTVPSANSTNSFGGMTVRRIAPFTLTNGQSQPVATIGQFELAASCTINAANTDIAALTITTNQNNSALDANDIESDFDIGEVRQFAQASVSPTGTPIFDQENDGSAIAPDGTEILGQEFYVGVNVLNQAGRCRYGGTLYVG